MKPSSLTQERLKFLLCYDPDTGIFTWAIDPAGHKRKRGDVAGQIDRHGYRIIGIDNQRYQASRLAFFWMTGRWPMPECDHIDGDQANNRWRNLREASRIENLRNKKIQSNNKVGLKGTYLHSPGKWRSRLKIDGRMVELGLFDCPAAARLAYIVAADKHFGEFAKD